MRRQAGYTLLELVVSAAILGILMIALVQSFTNTQKTHIMVGQVTAAQQNLRLIADLMERDIRISGYLVPRHGAVCGVDSLNGPDTLYLSDADVLLSVADLQAQGSPAVAGNLGAQITGVAAGGTIGGMGTDILISERWLDVANASDFGVGRGVIVVDRSDLAGRSICGTITAFTPNMGTGATIRVDFASPALNLPGGIPPDLVAIPAHVYSINVPPPGVAMPYQLIRDGALVANDVEDIQIGLFFDNDDDGVLDPGEFLGDDGSAVGDGVALQYSPDLADGRALRQIEINIVIATESDDPNQLATAAQQQVTGNRNPASLPATDRKRRRVYSSTVRLRNV